MTSKPASSKLRVAISLLVLVAAGLAVWKYSLHSRTNPWTRDGQVRAQIVQIAPRVSAPIIHVAVVDNQSVKAGDLLFELDPSTFQAELEQAEAQLELAKSNYEALDQQVKASKAGVTAAKASVDQAKSSIKQAEASVEKNKAERDRQQALLPRNATSKKAVQSAEASYSVSIEKFHTAQASLTQAKASLAQADAQLASSIASRGAEGEANASIRSAKAAMQEAQLNLRFTKAVAPIDGHVTNLNIRTGTQAVANQPILALVDHNSYWITGFFKETQIEPVRAGDPAEIKLMGYRNKVLKGTVESIGWGISQQDGSTGNQLLPTVNPTFDWIRLAQRMPVQIRLDEVPEGVELRVGATASVVIHTGAGS